MRAKPSKATLKMNAWLRRKRPEGGPLVRHVMDEKHPDERMNKSVTDMRLQPAAKREMG